ncbi:MAG: hypothetical protein M3442_13235 [Chloroflexota bacterium]|nr:hypothetical protein [Chloroflexota bacterium]
MNVEQIEQQLAQAETNLAQALHYLHATRRSALTEGYDSAEYDRALVGYRLAEQEVRTARQAWAAVHSGQTAPAPASVASGALGLVTAPTLTADPENSAPSEPFEPTPRMRFARWLVQTGRLSEELSA